MNKREYLNKLLQLCDDKQRNVFERMYGEGPSPKQLGWAITQVENTIKMTNDVWGELRDAQKQWKGERSELLEKLKTAEDKLRECEQELREEQHHVERLSNPTRLRAGRRRIYD